VACEGTVNKRYNGHDGYKLGTTQSLVLKLRLDGLEECEDSRTAVMQAKSRIETCDATEETGRRRLFAADTLEYIFYLLFQPPTVVIDYKGLPGQELGLNERIARVRVAMVSLIGPWLLVRWCFARGWARDMGFFILARTRVAGSGARSLPNS
jgi:hypothetical protein